MSLPKNKKEAFKALIDQLDDILSNNGCNDAEVANTPELYEMLEKAGARNLGLNSIQEFREHKEYQVYKPIVNEAGTKIYTYDFILLGCLKKELGL